VDSLEYILIICADILIEIAGGKVTGLDKV
jgi:hypothetical protein